MAPGILSQDFYKLEATWSKEAVTIRSPVSCGPVQYKSGEAVRLASRDGTYSSITSGQAPGFVQASPVILPQKYANDFRLLCARNPVPCPLLAEAEGPGVYHRLKSYIRGVSGEALARDLDVRKDNPRYMVYRGGKLVKDSVTDIMEEWTDESVTFLIGCSYSFETALTAAGLPPRHVVMDYNCPMYRTTIPLNPAGIFTGASYVISMRTYKAKDIPRVIAITGPFIYNHGEPIAWGWDGFEKLGIKSIDQPEWGDSPKTEDGRPLSEAFGDESNVPVFWGCGTTPQDAVMRAGLPESVMCHCPGHILVLDATDNDVRMNIETSADVLL